MLLAEILLKIGAYGLIQINIHYYHMFILYFSPWLMVVGTMQIIYVVSISFSQCNLKNK